MARPFAFRLLSLAALALAPAVGFSYGTGHHGGMILDCTPPVFFEESPGKDAKVAVLESFSFTASDNTDPATLEVRVNVQPVKFTVTPQRSGRYTVEVKLPQPIVQGRAWIKVTGVSTDGCDQLHNWNVYTGQ
jgi:hypothetical protein